MASFSRFCLNRFNLRYYYTIMSRNCTTVVSSKEKKRTALAIIKTESDPERILEICRSVSLTPESHLDRIIFSIAVSKFSQANDCESIQKLLEDCKARPDLKTERFASHAIILYGRAGMLDHAIRTFKEIDELGIPRTVKSLNALLLSCVFAKNYNEVKRVFIEFPNMYGIEPNLETFNTVIKALCESGSSRSAFSVLSEMDRKGLKPNARTFGTLLAGFYSEENYADVGNVLNVMQEKYGMRQNVEMYNIRIQSLCKLKRSSQARSLFEGMVSRGVKPNSITYCHLIHGFCEEGKLEEAKKLFQSMGNSGCIPNSECYFTIIYFLCQGGDFEAALKICQESMAKNWVPYFSIMRLLVDGLVSISKAGEARKLIRQVKEKFSDNVDLWNEIEARLPRV